MALDPSEKIYLGNNKLAVRTQWGGHVVVPSFNLDVALGAARDGVIEPWTTRVVQAILKPGDVYLNAGANFGYYIALAGHLVGVEGKVYAVEPNPYIFPFLMNTIYWNGTPNQTEMYNRALADVEGLDLTFSFDPQYLGGGSSAIHVTGIDRPPAKYPAFTTLEAAFWSVENLPRQTLDDGRVIETIGLMIEFPAKTTTIDKICQGSSNVSLIHLDIEGAEAFALAGSIETIKRSPGIKFITEWSAYHHYVHGTEDARHHFIAFWNLVESMGYRVSRIETVFSAEGKITLSQPLSLAEMTQTASHGDYVWAPINDPFWTSSDINQL